MINAFVGPKKAGKSNIIKCLEILNSISRNDWNDMYIDNVFDYDNSKRITVEVEFYLNNGNRLSILNKIFANSTLVDDKNPIFRQIKYLITFGNNKIYREKVSVLNSKAEYNDLIVHEFD